MKLNIFKKRLVEILFGILLSISITEPSFASDADSKYEASWQKISGSLTIEDQRDSRRGDAADTYLVDNYELFNAVGQTVSIYLKGNPLDNGLGLCDPYLIIYSSVDSPGTSIEQDDDSGRGGAADSHNGINCGFPAASDSFITITNWQPEWRIQVTAFLDIENLIKNNTGDYTLYVSVGNFGLTENSLDTAPWIGAQSITCPPPNPWVREKLGFASNAKPVLVSAENTIGKTITQGSYDALKSSGVVFDTVSTKVSTATETLPIYGCKDKLLSGKVNQPIQFIAGGYTLQSDAHGYINTADLKWHDTNSVTLYTNTAAFMHTIKFTQTGKYVVVLTEQPDTSRGLIPTYGVRSVRFVINVN